MGYASGNNFETRQHLQWLSLHHANCFAFENIIDKKHWVRISWEEITNRPVFDKKKNGYILTRNIDTFLYAEIPFLTPFIIDMSLWLN